MEGFEILNQLVKENNAENNQHNLKLVIQIAKGFNRPDIELDLIQEGALAAWQAEQKYNADKGAISTFLAPVIKNAMLKYIRSEDKAEIISLQTEINDNLGETLETTISSYDRSLEEEVEATTIAAAMKTALESLTPRQREAIILKFGLDKQGERTNAEVGEAMGISRQAAESLISYGLKGLKKIKELQQFAL